jgi:hypothetical protein
VKERPILFSSPMVRAILDGTKTVTRRIYKPRPQDNVNDPLGPLWSLPSPYGAPGDRLWVRETWQAIHVSVDPETGYGDDVYAAEQIPSDARGGWWSPVYAATDPQANDHKDDRGFPWRPGIHMPRWASRIDLEVVSVRVERLHAITEEDAKAEGVERYDDDGVTYYGPLNRGHACAAVAFERLWREINGIESWLADPWVWRVEFKRVEVSR